MQIFVVLVGDRLMNWWDGDGTTVILQDLNPWDSIWSVMQKIDEEEGIDIDYENSKEKIYGMSYKNWKDQYQKEI